MAHFCADLQSLARPLRMLLLAAFVFVPVFLGLRIGIVHLCTSGRPSALTIDVGLVRQTAARSEV